MTDAWTQLYIETRQPLMAYACRRAHAADAADAVAETYARAMTHIDAYRPDRPVVCWLVGILRNVLREQARHREEPVGEAPAPAPADGDPLSFVLRSEESDGLRVALDRLTADERRVVVMRVVEGRTSAETGVATGRAPAAVRMIQTRAVRRLRTLYAEAG